MPHTQPPDARTLEDTVPELLEYLKPGMDVLDIGCGPATITVDVAKVISPGNIVGLNTLKQDHETARQWAAEMIPNGNISFCMGDSHQLDFSAHSFDLVYSHTVAHFFIDPVRALQEQARVTKPGGWVIAAGVRDIGPRYPVCPNWEKLWTAWIQHNDHLRKTYKENQNDPVQIVSDYIKQSDDFAYHYDIEAGRKCMDWFSQAGFKEVTLSAKVTPLRYQGEEAIKPLRIDLVTYDDMEEDKRAFVKGHHERMVAGGFTDWDTITAAEAEARDWYKDRRAYCHWTNVFAAGRVLR